VLLVETSRSVLWAWPHRIRNVVHRRSPDRREGIARRWPRGHSPLGIVLKSLMEDAVPSSHALHLPQRMTSPDSVGFPAPGNENRAALRHESAARLRGSVLLPGAI